MGSRDSDNSARRFKGVETHGRGIRLDFQYRGQRCRPKLDLAPTPRGLKYAADTVRDIKAHIRSGTFRWEEWFPDDDSGPSDSSMPFNQLADAYLESLDHLAFSTLRGYRGKLRYWRNQFGETPIKDLTHSRVTKAITHIGFTSPKTRNDALSVLRQCLGFAKDDRLLEHNAAARIPWKRRSRPQPDPLAPDEVEAILDHMAKHEDAQVHNYFEFAFFTGMRPSEIIALNWDDADLRKGLVRVNKARVYQQIKDTKTYEVRDVELMSRARNALNRQKAFTFLNGGPIFLNPETGRPLHDEKSMRLIWNRVLKKLGIRHRVAYQARHTYATLNLMAGANPMWVARMMGHRNPNITMNTYSKWIDGVDQSSEVSKLEQALSRGAKIGAK